MEKRQTTTCSKCRYCSKGFCTVKGQQVADTTRERICKAYRK